MAKLTERQEALLKKLQALAERGVGGEKANAQRMLDDMLKKLGLTMEDLIEDPVDVRLIKYKDELQKKFYNQVIASVMGNISIWGHKQYKKTLIFEATHTEYIEIKAKCIFFFRDYIRQRQLFYKAYIQKNELYRKNEGEKQEDDKMSEEEYWELMQMMKGIEKKEFRTQLDKKPMQIEHKDE